MFSVFKDDLIPIQAKSLGRIFIVILFGSEVTYCPWSSLSNLALQGPQKWRWVQNLRCIFRDDFHPKLVFSNGFSWVFTRVLGALDPNSNGCSFVQHGVASWYSWFYIQKVDS